MLFNTYSNFLYRLSFIILLLISASGCKKDNGSSTAPPIPLVNAGNNQLNVGAFQTTLNADVLKEGQTGKWTIVKGLVEEKVFFADDTKPNSKFNGMPGETYELKWTVLAGGQKYSESTVKIAFKPLRAIIGYVSPGKNTQFTLAATKYDTGEWTIDKKYARIENQISGGTYVPPLNAHSIMFQGYARTTYQIKWSTSYGSKKADTTITLKTGDYAEEEALKDLQQLAAYRVGYENGRVTKLDLKGSGVASLLQDTLLYPTFQAFTALKYLDLEASTVFKFPEVIGEKYRELEYLNLRSTRINSIPSNIGNLTKLKEFYVGYLQWNMTITSLPESFGNLESLEVLNVSTIGLTSLPESLSKLKKLRHFEAYLNPIAKLPTRLGDMESLQTLMVSTQENIPASVSKLSKLKRLYFVTTNTNVKLPDDFGNLSSLDTLKIEAPLRELPASFSNLDLKDMFISTPVLTALPDKIGNMKNLVSLTVGGMFKTLPASFTNLTKLKYLTTGGALEYFPKDLGNLTSLEYLDCQSASLKELPESIGQLSNLTELQLRNNQIATLPAGFFNLPKIGRITLSYNKLSSLSDDFAKLKNTLYTLYLYGNNFPKSDGEKIKQLLPKTAVYFDN